MIHELGNGDFELRWTKNPTKKLHKCDIDVPVLKGNRQGMQ